MARWTAADLAGLSGKTIVVTGANSGIGLEAARELAGRGAELVLACRDAGKAKAAVESITADHPSARLEVMALDLASLASVRAFAESLLASRDTLHVLCNNAGVMALPPSKTADGFEMQFGTNHLGHFALTGLLLARLLETPGGRVVNVSSNLHRMGRMRFDDLHGERSYRKWGAYTQSKLANLLFTYELQRKLDARGAKLVSVACHPGYAATNLQLAGPRMEGSAFGEAVQKLFYKLFAQSAAMGALPTLRAAADPDVKGGEYYGPDGLTKTSGYPIADRSSPRSYDVGAAAKLWEISEELTGVRYGL